LPLSTARTSLTKEKESESLRELLEAVNPDRKKLSYRILNNVVAPVLAAILVVAVWPVAVYMKVKEMLKKKDGAGVEEEREFAVERQHLLERLTVQEVEKREVVTDPLKAAPELPFGHLNGAWKEFLNGKPDGGELWSFSARWQTTWGRKELRSGIRDGPERSARRPFSDRLEGPPGRGGRWRTAPSARGLATSPGGSGGRLTEHRGVEQAVVSPAAISITVGRAGCSYRDRTDHTG
jgi:hypothetical protein